MSTEFNMGDRVVCIREGSRFFGASGEVCFELPSGNLLVDFNDTPASISPDSLRMEDDTLKNS